MTNTTSRAPKVDEGDHQKNEERAEQLTDQATAGQEILIAAREAAAKRGILVIPFLAALYVGSPNGRRKASSIG